MARVLKAERQQRAQLSGAAAAKELLHANPRRHLGTEAAAMTEQDEEPTTFSVVVNGQIEVAEVRTRRAIAHHPSRTPSACPTLRND